MSRDLRVVLVSRRSEYELLLERYATHGEARFVLESRGRKIDPVVQAHARYKAATAALNGAIPARWRRTRIDRRDLDRFLFEPDDVIVAVGQDGLVANVAKYLQGQLVLGINPDPSRNSGVLVQHSPAEGCAILPEIASVPAGLVEHRTMVKATLPDGQTLHALNEIFVGHRTHQSARYVLELGDQLERQSSSGIVFATGTGSTGWALSIARSRREEQLLTEPCDGCVGFFVREAFPSVSTHAETTAGKIRGGKIHVRSEMNEDGVIFGDGIEADYLAFDYGTRATISVAERTLRLLGRSS